ncbi:iron chelate uptake ABC transporter family permease subunit [Clostridium sp. Marseille-QA1073]
MKHKKIITFLSILSLILIVLFVGIGLNINDLSYALSRRIPKVAAIILTAISIAFSSMVFQTITNNRILTPSVLGLDSLYIFIQTVVIFLFGAKSIFVVNNNLNFILSVGIMIIFAILLYKLLFKRENNNIFFLLLVGLIFGTLFQSLSSFMQMIINPNEFLIIQDKMFASFNNVSTNDLMLSSIVVILAIAYCYDYIKILDVLSLGKDEAINLGVDYDKVVKRMLIVIVILVSVSTTLVGPITFLGLLVVNLTKEFLNTYKHKYLLVGSMLISIIALIGGQLIVERIFTLKTPLSVIINFIGGIYFMYLLLKENK